MTEDIGQLKEDLTRKVAACLSHGEEVVKLTGELERKESEVKRNSKLQQRESALLKT